MLNMKTGNVTSLLERVLSPIHSADVDQAYLTSFISYH